MSKLAPSATVEAQLKAFDLCSGHIECEQPNAATNKFAGNLHLSSSDAEAQRLIDGMGSVAPITIANVLMRGSSVRNTECVLGLVINTGVDTKVMQGARKPPTKSSTLDRQINHALAVVILLLATLCLVGTVGNIVIANSDTPGIKGAWYLPSDAVNTIVIFFQNLALLNSFVSIMLPFSVTSVKALHTWFAEQSLHVYHEETDTRLAVRTMTLVDEAGIISHIFSDKTGTLTQNIMQFRKCSIAGTSYGKGTTEMGVARLKRLGLPLPPPTKDNSSANKVVNFDGPELHAALNGEGGEEQQRKCRDFFLHLALCHTVVAETVGNDRRLSAASPDEAALVAAAAYFGLDFLDRNQEQVQLHDHYAKADVMYEVLDVLEFTSQRRRMSVVVRDTATGAVRLLCKGADTVMMKLLKPGQQAAVEATEQAMEDHSNEGLRCLVVAQKMLEPQAYLTWSTAYRKALSDIAELEKKGDDLPNQIDRLCDELELELEMLGSTAIEDKLQDGVPSCIADMGRAGIAVWVLTGDKQETAINIAFACQLVDNSSKMHIVSKKTHPTAEEVRDALVVAAVEAEAKLRSGKASKHALVIDGECLEDVMRTSSTGELVGSQAAFLRFTQHCTSVVCCRCAPTQKAQVVSLVRYSVKGAVALAIGDGANDVAMIQAADVGVGISGQEGMQAANSADFAVGQFRFLRELLLVQGRNMYRRQTTLVCYVFYKSIMMVLTSFWFFAFAAMSGQKMHLEIGVQAFNVMWTSVPIYCLALFDRDVSDETARLLPQLYHLGIRRHYNSWWVYARWLFEAFYESAAITLVCVFGLVNSSRFGETPGVWYIGAHTLTTVIITVNMKLFLSAWQLTRMLVGWIVLMVSFWWCTNYIASMQYCEASTFTPPTENVMGSDPAAAPVCIYVQLDIFVLGWQGLWQVVQEEAPFWLLLLLLVPTLMVPSFVLDTWRKRFYPEFRDLAIEAEFFGLPLAPLEKWEVPLELRSLPLLPDAPRMTKRPFSMWPCGAKKRAGPSRDTV